MNKYIKVIGVCSVIAGSSGCAAMLTGTSDTITFNSGPEGAKVLIDGMQVGRACPNVTELRKANQELDCVTIKS